jgi:PAS domain S-box-containing protein
VASFRLKPTEKLLTFIEDVIVRGETFAPENPERMNIESAQALLWQLANSFPSAPVAFQPTPPDLVARYRTLVEQIPAVIFMAFLDQDISEAYVSPHVETVLGFTQQEWLNDPVRWYNQIHPDDRTRWSIEAAQLILSGQPLRSVYRVIARDGHVVWFHCQVKMVLSEDGCPWFLHGTAFDITDLKRAELSLQQAHDELDARVLERTAELAQANRNLKQEIAGRERAQAELARTVEDLKRSNRCGWSPSTARCSRKNSRANLARAEPNISVTS